LARTIAKGAIQLEEMRSLEVPDPTLAILDKMQHFVKTKGARFVIGTVAADPSLKSFTEKSGTPLIDLTTRLRFRIDGSHWTPEGHQWVSGQIHDRYGEMFGTTTADLPQ